MNISRVFSIYLLWLNIYYFSICKGQEIIHEDIKDAMLSLVHLMRENTEKLERHEVRERQLGDQMKKAIGLLSKKMNALEEIQIRFIESDKRITDLEQLYYQVSSVPKQVSTTDESSEFLKVHFKKLQDDVEEKLFNHNILVEKQTQMIDKLMNMVNDIPTSIQNILKIGLAKPSRFVDQELLELNKTQALILAMADDILNTKKMVEYSVHQILLGVENSMKSENLIINNTLEKNFSFLTMNLSNSQKNMENNLTDTMEREMSQVWRQLNLMYQQMNSNGNILHQLHTQTDFFANGTMITINGMNYKISEISKKITEIDGNLNYLLGRLSITMQEFNQIKTELGIALDDTNQCFKKISKNNTDPN
ncbi:uncharacterized protein LOC103572922 [Microplitis demolitor]|uniref:uncharacterized protein LOC103572922 n=1 Tax=Microplitis demolitor TaxID=69319 RepID=UPI0004CCD7E8|nr:uncharacterized protein LOC103572922 [Microplitis demolitor]